MGFICLYNKFKIAFIKKQVDEYLVASLIKLLTQQNSLSEILSATEWVYKCRAVSSSISEAIEVAELL